MGFWKGLGTTCLVLTMGFCAFIGYAERESIKETWNSIFNQEQQQVEAETKEEARIVLGKIIYTGYSYFKFFKNKYTNCPIHWDGTHNEVYIAYFKKWYRGKINNKLKDSFIDKYGRFIPFEYAINILSEDHQKALNLIPR